MATDLEWDVSCQFETMLHGTTEQEVEKRAMEFIRAKGVLKVKRRTKTFEEGMANAEAGQANGA